MALLVALWWHFWLRALFDFVWRFVATLFAALCAALCGVPFDALVAARCALFCLRCLVVAALRCYACRCFHQSSSGDMSVQFGHSQNKWSTMRSLRPQMD